MRERNLSMQGPLMMSLLLLAASGYRPHPEAAKIEEERAFDRMVQIEKESKVISQLHRFVIRGKEVYARNKKDALKKAARL